MKQVKMYTDGGCLGNPERGGYMVLQDKNLGQKTLKTVDLVGHSFSFG